MFILLLIYELDLRQMTLLQSHDEEQLFIRFNTSDLAHDPRLRSFSQVAK